MFCAWSGIAKFASSNHSAINSLMSSLTAILPSIHILYSYSGNHLCGNILYFLALRVESSYIAGTFFISHISDLISESVKHTKSALSGTNVGSVTLSYPPNIAVYIITFFFISISHL